MKILITGCSGLLGSNLCQHFSAHGHEVIGLWHTTPPVQPAWRCRQGDLLDAGQTLRLLEEERPQAVINCVALVNIDRCEADPELARRVNAESVAPLARGARVLGSRLIHISTDHLFDGRRSFYTEDDPPSPVNEYGRSKLGGERLCLAENPEALVVRTNFYGWVPAGHPPAFSEWLYESLRERKPIRLIKDYFFNSLEVHFLAEALEKLAQTRAAGILNAVSSERVSKYEFGVAMAEAFGFGLESVSAVSLRDHPFRVQRPPDLSLSTAKFEKALGYRPAGLLEGLRALRRSLPSSLVTP